MKKIFFSLLAVGLSLTANAQLVDGGNYFVKNVETGTYMTGGNNWGTHISVSPSADYLTATQISDGVYTLDSHISNGGDSHFVGNADFLDSGAANLTITAVGEGIYTIGVGDKFYAVTSGTLVERVSAATDNKAKWQFITLEEYKASLASASKSSPLNATLLIRDANFGRNNQLSSSWTVEAGCTNKNLSGGNNANNCAESFHSKFNIHQVIDVPNGVYKLTAQGFYRQDGSDNENLPVFYANGETKTFPIKTGAENNMSAASESFTKGSYTIEPIKVTVTDGKLDLGVKCENTTLWCIWDNFVLTYYGVPNIATSKSAFDEAYKSASNLYTQEDLYMDAEIYNSLGDVVSKYKDASYETADEYDDATDEINGVLTDVNASVKFYNNVYDLLVKYQTLISELDEDGQAYFDENGIEIPTANMDLYNGELDTSVDYAAKFAEEYRLAVVCQTTPGSDMTGAIVNPNFDGNINGWTDTFSGKLNHGFQNNATYGTINQFMECWAGYWSGAATPYILPDGRLYQTVKGLNAGKYELSADIIATQQEVGKEGYIGSHAEETGIYIFAESGVLFKSDAISIEAGALDHNVKFTFSTTGGNTDIGLLVDGTNCNWVVMDNVKLVFVGADDSMLDAEIKNAKNLYALMDSSKEYAKTLNEAIQSATQAYEDGGFTVTTLNKAIEDLQKAEKTAKDAFKIDNYAVLEDGKYIIANETMTGFLGAGNDWGTQASVLAHPEYLEIARSENGKYTIKSQVSNGGNSQYFTGSWMDGQATEIEIIGESSVISTVQICNGENYFYDNNGLVGTTKEETHYWVLMSVEAYEAYGMNEVADEEADKWDFTHRVLDANFGRNNVNSSAWAIKGATAPKTSGTVGVTNANFLVEAYKKPFSVKQVITGLPEGVYEVKATAMYRQDGTDATLPYVFINGVKTDFAERTGTENNMQSVAASMATGLYEVSAKAYVMGGQIAIGAATEGTSCWSIFDNFQLYYLGTDAEAENSEYASMEIAAVEGAAENYGTFCAPFDAALPEGVTAYVVDGIDLNGITVCLTAINGVEVPAHTPVILASENAVSENACGEYVEGELDNEGALQGVYEATPAPEASYVLQNQNGVVGFYLVAPTVTKVTVPANRCYLLVEAEDAAAPRALFFGQAEATAVQTINALATNKIEAVYTLGGAKVNGLQKGINVVKMADGKTAKILVK